MTDRDRVIVVGAGPVGLVTAMLLAGAGIPVLVIERADSLDTDLRASTFHPPTLDMLAPSGLTASLLEEGLVCRTWQIRLHATGERAEFDLGLLAADTDHPYRLQCEQSRLCRHLVARLGREGGVSLRFSTSLTGLVQHGDHVVATLETAEAGREQAAARFVVGADGAGSTVRGLVGLEFTGETYPETTVLASTRFPFEQHLADLANVSYSWAESGNFALLRLRDFWRASLYYEPGLDWAEAVSPARIAGQLGQICPAAREATVVDRRAYRVHQRIVADYRRGRVLLAGDAAHVNSPSGGMGMNGGIHDAFELAEALIAVWHGGEEDALDRYTRRRRPVAERQILAQADRNRRRMRERDPAKRRAMLRELQATAAEPRRAREHLLRTSMIAGLRAARSVA